MPTLEQRLLAMVAACPMRMRALGFASALMDQHDISDWYLAAGAVRNLVWERLHGFAAAVPEDLDLIFFRRPSGEQSLEKSIQADLKGLAPELPWSVKDQGRMHHKSGDAPYDCTVAAMARWPELETAVGVRLKSGCLRLAAPFGLKSLFALQLTPNPFCSPALFHSRLAAKGWLRRYPGLRLATAPGS